MAKGGAAIYATLERNALCSVDYADMTNLVPCSHEEADTRLLLHVADADKAGYKKVCVPTVDTDVVVLAVAHYNNKKPDELWVLLAQDHISAIYLSMKWLLRWL